VIAINRSHEPHLISSVVDRQNCLDQDIYLEMSLHWVIKELGILVKDPFECLK